MLQNYFVLDRETQVVGEHWFHVALIRPFNPRKRRWGKQSEAGRNPCRFQIWNLTMTPPSQLVTETAPPTPYGRHESNLTRLLHRDSSNSNNTLLLSKRLPFPPLPLTKPLRISDLGRKRTAFGSPIACSPRSLAGAGDFFDAPAAFSSWQGRRRWGTASTLRRWSRTPAPRGIPRVRGALFPA